MRFPLRVVRLCQSVERSAVSRALVGQLLRSATSVGADAEEAQGSQKTAHDFISKMCIACKEARESHYWLRLLEAAEIVPAAKLSSLIGETNQIVAILTTIVKNSKTPR